MAIKVSSLALLALFTSWAAAGVINNAPQIYLLGDALEANTLTNIYLDYGSTAYEGRLTISFGACDQPFETHNIIGTTEVTTTHQPSKFIWSVPSDKESGCVFAITSRKLQEQSSEQVVTVLAQSKPFSIQPKKLAKRAFPQQVFFDAVKYFEEHIIKSFTTQTNFVADNKDKKIGIIGAGISGLFSGYLLDQAGLHNYEIIEASDRMGGRIHTVYFNSEQTVYQEMGGMRIPISWTHNSTTLPITDHDIVFQLMDELNELNDDEHKVEFIPWIQMIPNNLVYRNGVRLSNGKIPTVGEIQSNPGFLTGDPLELADQVASVIKELDDDSWKVLMGQDLYAAHQKALDEGYEDWSLWGWLHNKMGVSLNATDFGIGTYTSLDVWSYMYHSFLGAGTEWRTVQGGMNRITNAIAQFVQHKVSYNTKITKLAYEKDDKISVHWKESSAFDAEYHWKLFDKVIVSTPFSVTRMWHLPPELPYSLSRAINDLGYGQSCKVALEFKTRFWEHYEKPILGGCDITDLKSEFICYPSYNLGSDGPGVMLASYTTDDGGLRFASMSEEDHIARVLEDMVELHGIDIIKEQYTGNYHRKCWILDPFQSGAWAQPSAGQTKLFTPAYFEHANGIVFIGEQTSIKHAWISGALESAIRGVTMILVEMGHIDEARNLVQKWNAKWMKV